MPCSLQNLCTVGPLMKDQSVPWWETSPRLRPPCQELSLHIFILKNLSLNTSLPLQPLLFDFYGGIKLKEETCSTPQPLDLDSVTHVCLTLSPYMVTLHCHLHCHLTLSPYIVTLHCHLTFSPYIVTLHRHLTLSPYTLTLHGHLTLSPYTVTGKMDFEKW